MCGAHLVQGIPEVVRALTFFFFFFDTLNVQARAWPEMCGAHLVRGIPEVVDPAPTSVLQKEAAAYFATDYYQQLFVQVKETSIS
jgi:hypothetical protein